MDAMSSQLFRNAFCHPNCILSSRAPPNKFNTTRSLCISSSLTIHGDKLQQDLKRPKTYTCSSSTFSLSPPQLQETASSSSASVIKARSRTRLSLIESIMYILFNALDDIINKFIDPPLRLSVHPKHVLSNNFAPVNELPPTECSIIEGTLPPCLDGAYIRNGPNPQYFPRGPYHLFDGEGMLHSLRISNGVATLCSRYVQTYKYKIELEAGCQIIPNFFSGFNGLPAIVARGALFAARVLCGQCNPVNGIGLANTSLAFFGNKLFALAESDLPYQIRLTPNNDIETIGRHDFEGKFPSMSTMTAHPKIDAQTGETFAFRTSILPPYLTYFWFDTNGTKQPDIPIYSMAAPTLIHDFAITSKYAVFTDIQIGMTTNPMDLLVSGGSMVRADPKKVPRIGVLPRYAKDESEMRWFDVPEFNIMHAINAWDDDEEEDSIILIAPNMLSVGSILERMDLIHASVENVRINLKSGTVTRFPISTKNLDFGAINPNFMGKKNKYGYLGVSPVPKISGAVKLVEWSSGVVKLDWSSEGGREVGCRMFGNGCYGGEPIFIPKQKDLSSTKGVEEDEDDGYLVTYMHDENSGESKFLVMDAKSPTLDIIATVKLPGRVPYGFHGLFVRDSDLIKL